jgi:hypothetical protein
MNEACRFESQILRAARSETLTDAQRAHLADCADCAAAVSVAPWIDGFSRISDREHRLPDPSFLWLKAKLLQGSAEASRAARPLNAIQFFAYGIVAAAWAAVLTWRWDAVQTWLRGLTPAGMVKTAVNAPSLSLPLMGTLVVLASITVLLALHTILAED